MNATHRLRLRGVETLVNPGGFGDSTCVRFHIPPVRKALEGKGFSKRGRPLVKLYHLQVHWERIVGPLLAQRSFPQMLDRGKLTIGVESSVWAQQLGFLQTEIKANVHDVVGEMIREVKCVQHAHIPKPPTPIPRAVPPRLEEEAPAESLTSQDRERSLQEIIASAKAKALAMRGL